MLSRLRTVTTSSTYRSIFSTKISSPNNIRNNTLSLSRFLSSTSNGGPAGDTHDDFAPKRKSISNEDEAHKAIHEHVTSNRIMLYMKGNPAMPMCGFSARVIKILQDEGVDFSSVNVLDYPAIREGVKSYSQWPTIPQLYVDGELIGGCDIVTSMHESGELADLVKVDAK
mmetsp:Transcript_3171/g.4221  ORF Transcript_3171/g.4221 Transcript_3171/m.4221 type:complete len:170 (+) Transcript_3171:146-655(+)